MVGRHAWFLNLDAEDELARPAGYTPSRAMLARIEVLSGRLRATSGFAPGGGRAVGGSAGLVGEDDIVVGEGQSEGLSGELVGMAWCPTPRARRALAKVGVVMREAPGLAVLREVNHRRFCAGLGQTLPGARFAESVEEVRDALSGESPTGRWLIKRPYGYAGRGRLEVEPARAGELERARSWIEASLRGGDGVQVEPLVERRGDFALHGYLARDGSAGPVIGEPTRQVCDATGAWNGSVRAEAGEMETREREALFEEVRRAAMALGEAGYFGPFGVDAFRYEDGRGRACFNARCEINARYSMGWAVGMGDRRPDLEERRDGAGAEI